MSAGVGSARAQETRGNPTDRGVPRRPPRAEHVGSLLRPAALKQAIGEVYEPGHTALLAEERSRDRSHLRAVEDELIRDAVARQAAAGLDVVSDGEFRRVLFVNSFYDAVSGLRPSDRLVEFHRESGETLTYPGPPIVDDRLAKTDSPGQREAAFLAETTDFPFKVTFPAASWFVSPFLFPPDQVPTAYADREELSAHARAILRELIEDAIAAGARYIQLDYPTYVYLVDDDVVSGLRAMGADPAEILEQSLGADREVVEGLPDDVRVALHICRGNYRSSWMFRGSLEPVAERLFNELPYDSFLIEWEDVDREGDYSPLRHLPKGPLAVVGIISSKWPELEAEDDVLRRVQDASRYVDIDQLGLSPQCGFASSAEGNELDEDAQWRKLELVGRVADRLWPSG